MNINEISFNELMEEVVNVTSAFLCGNGFSINFDDDYKAQNLVKRLFSTHCYLKGYGSYDIISNKSYKFALNENYKATKKIIDKINCEKAFLDLFSDAVSFARSIVENESVIFWLNDNEFNSKLTFGLSHLDLVRSIVSQANSNGDLYVNYEYWTVLIYYILALKNAPPELYSFDTRNLFVSAVLAGSTYSLFKENENGKNLFPDSAINGMFTYLRFLFTANILLDGNSYGVTKLQKWDTYNINIIKSFLNKFNYLMTTNYDMLLENISSQKVYHLHGCYSKQKKRVMSQSLGVYYNLVRYDLSTAVIRDYFLSKSFLQIVSKLAAKEKQNSNIEIYGEILEKIIKENRSQLIVVFGLNMENDFHIFRDIQFLLESVKNQNPHIVYCYFSEDDKTSFIHGYDACITYSTELCDFVRNNIKVSIIDSRQIIQNIFVKSND